MTSTESVPDRFGRRRFLRLCLAGAVAPVAGCARGPLAMNTVDDAVATRTVEAGGVRLLALTAGRGGPPVVLIHGASGNARDWTFGALQALGRRGATVAFDRPGFGGSEPAPTRPESPFAQAALMREGVAALGHERPILVGHSYGGSVALAWALDAPETVAGLVLLAAPSQVWPGGVGLASELLAGPVLGPLVATAAPRLLPRAVVDAAAERIFAPQEPPPGYIERLGVARLLDPAGLRLNARQVTALKGYIRDMVPRYPALGMPVELLHGDADTIVPLEVHSAALARQLPRARLTVLPGIGHMPHHADPASLLAAVDRVAAQL